MCVCVCVCFGLQTNYVSVDIVQRMLSYYRGADKSLAQPTYQCILFDGENISFDASLVIYTYK